MAVSRKTQSIEVAWNRIEVWLVKHWFEPVKLPLGVDEEAISRFEIETQMKMPSDLKHSLRVHDGTGKIPLVAFDSFKVPFPLLSLGDTLAQWSLIQKGIASKHYSGPDFKNKPEGPIQKVWFHPKWIPVVDNQSGDYLFADLSPAKGGRRGQIIDFFRTSGAVHVFATSFSDLLEHVASELESGIYKVDKKSRSLVNIKK